MGVMTQSKRGSRIIDLAPVARAVGARIRARRLAAGLTQRQVAAGEYTPAYISALERGLAKPSVASLYYLAGRLGCEAADFLREDPRDPQVARLRVAQLRFSDTHLTFVAHSGVELAVPLAWFPLLAAAPLSELRKHRIDDDGRVVTWRTLGVRVDVDQLLGAEPNTVASGAT